MGQDINGPYQITLEDIERSSTLDSLDIDEWYVLLNGTYQFVESFEEGEKLIKLLRALK